MTEKYKRPAPVPTDETRRARCSFCGGRGASAEAETVVSPIGLKYRIPKNHIACKQSVLCLSLEFGGGVDRREPEGE